MFKKILKEEVSIALTEASITKRFQKAVEALQTIQLKQQDLRKKFVAEKDPKKKEKFKQSLISLHKKVEQAEKDFNKAVTSEPIDDDVYEGKLNEGATNNKPAEKIMKGRKIKEVLYDQGEYYVVLDNGKFIKFSAWKITQGSASDLKKIREGKLTEDVFKSFLGDDPAFKLHMATNTDNRKSVKARKTDKTWDDGVPVLKYIARASKKDSPLPKGKFKIIDDSKYGWWYYQVGNTWYGIQQKDYGTPPFEY
jgi:hypothetical protein